ncbi:hypothetical protein G7Z17_g3638 [Cylindrodendrum hubeiense]|uniref:Isochorismatase-like domain-containing protein n=1 Tax=Cylindrodendrum hubeiense TaxID=595255 RepID=A0A9P5HE81_9HYPO|nr:hypothetical protein G7Z17_g3638 [Cylindrodendrum hubeiense]
MSAPTTSAPKTAIVLIDPYNDFIHPEGKLYGRVSESLTASDTVSHLKEIVKAAREAHIPIYYGLHQTWREGNYKEWQHMNSSTTALKSSKAFEEGSWGAEILEGLEPDVLGNGDVVVSKHWNSSSFANTDLDYQLHQREITHLVMAGMVANTCLETTARYGRELGYHVTLLTDGTAGFSTAAKDAATNLIWPMIVDRVMTVGEWTSTLKN